MGLRVKGLRVFWGLGFKSFVKDLWFKGLGLKGVGFTHRPLSSSVLWLVRVSRLGFSRFYLNPKQPTFSGGGGPFIVSL